MMTPSLEGAHVNAEGFDIIQNEGTLDQAKAFVAYANDIALGGHRDWVLPDVMTLQALDEITPKGRLFWSSSHPNLGSGNAFFDNAHGTILVYTSPDNHEVMPFQIVRASQRLAIGQAGHLKGLSRAGIVLGAQEPKDYWLKTLDFKGTLEETLEFAQKANAEAALGHTDWVLPDNYTLSALSLVATNWYESTHVFALKKLWTSSPYNGNTSWGIADRYKSTTKRCDARLVRSSQCLAIGQAGQLRSIAKAEDFTS
jgi:hypothetical protein